MKTDNEKIRVLNLLVSHYGIQYWWEDENRIKDWVAMILIQRTTERNCNLALANLEGYFTANELLEMNLEFLQELMLDDEGFVEHNNLKTDIRGVYVVGDVRNDSNRQIVNAVADGSSVVKLIKEYLER